MFNKMEEMFSFLKPATIHGSQLVAKRGEMSNVIANKVIASHDPNMVVLSNM